MPFKPGQSGNLNGRPKKQRTLTKLVDTALAHQTVDVQGQKISGKRLLASYVVQGVLTGKVTVPGDNQGEVREMTLAPRDWVEFVKWVYAQIDGPPPQNLRIAGEDGGPIKVDPLVHIYVPDNGRDKPVQENETP